MLKEVINKLSAFSINIKSKKSKFDKKEIDYLGFIISKECYKVDLLSKNLKKILIKVPSNMKNLKSKLGFINFFRKFIPKAGEI